MNEWMNGMFAKCKRITKSYENKVIYEVSIEEGDEDEQKHILKAIQS